MDSVVVLSSIQSRQLHFGFEFELKFLAADPMCNVRHSGEPGSIEVQYNRRSTPIVIDHEQSPYDLELNYLPVYI